VRLLTDEGSSVSAMVQSSRAQGMLEGSVDGTLRLAYIRTDQTINVGDIVVTSGLGGVFPKGLPLGRVSIVESAPGSSYYDIVVEPFAYPGLLEEVLVVTSLTEGQEATAEDIAIADAADVAAAGGTPREVVTEGEPSEGDDVEGEASWDEGLGLDGQDGAADTGSDEQAQGTGLSVSVRDVSTGVADEGAGAADADQ
jgi:rod shape-determining protein MreC